MINFGSTSVTDKKRRPWPNINLASTVKLDDCHGLLNTPNVCSTPRNLDASRKCLQSHQRTLPLKLRAVGQASLAGNHVVLTHHKCHLRLIEASPDGYKQLSEFKLYDSASKTIPALAGGRLYTRSDGANATLDCWKLN